MMRPALTVFSAKIFWWLFAVDVENRPIDADRFGVAGISVDRQKLA